MQKQKFFLFGNWIVLHLFTACLAISALNLAVRLQLPIVPSNNFRRTSLLTNQPISLSFCQVCNFLQRLQPCPPDTVDSNAQLGSPMAKDDGSCSLQYLESVPFLPIPSNISAANEGVLQYLYLAGDVYLSSSPFLVVFCFELLYCKLIWKSDLSLNTYIYFFQ